MQRVDRAEAVEERGTVLRGQGNRERDPATHAALSVYRLRESRVGGDIRRGNHGDDKCVGYLVVQGKTMIRV